MLTEQYRGAYRSLKGSWPYSTQSYVKFFIDVMQTSRKKWRAQYSINNSYNLVAMLAAVRIWTLAFRYTRGIMSNNFIMLFGSILQAHNYRGGVLYLVYFYHSKRTLDPLKYFCPTMVCFPMVSPLWYLCMFS